MSSIFNPTALTKNTSIAGLLDIMVTWNPDTVVETIAQTVDPGDTVITGLTISDTELILDLVAVEPYTKVPHMMHKEIKINKNYAMQEYADEHLYILYDYTKLTNITTAVTLEPYVAIFDNDYAVDYTGSTTINTDAGLNVFASDSGLSISIDLPLINVENIDTPVAVRCINGIVPTNGNIQIVGVGDTTVTVSQPGEG